MQDINKPLRSQSYSVPCELCSIGDMCIPMLLDNTLCTVLERKRSYLKNEILIAKGAPLKKFYIIHSGALKTYVTVDGVDQINGFYLPGDIIGLDGISTKKCNNTVQALTHTLVCELLYEELMELVLKNIKVRDMILNLMSIDIYNYQELLLCYSQKNAEEKLATFIHSLYTRYSRRGHVSNNIKLSMSRSDIASYLGLTIETISRILARMQDANILSVRGKYLYIKNLPALIEAS